MKYDDPEKQAAYDEWERENKANQTLERDRQSVVVIALVILAALFAASQFMIQALFN